MTLAHATSATPPATWRSSVGSRSAAACPRLRCRLGTGSIGAAGVGLSIDEVTW